MTNAFTPMQALSVAYANWGNTNILYQNKVFLFGGMNNNVKTNEIKTYDLTTGATNTWTEKLSTDTYDPVVILRGNLAYVLDGSNGKTYLVNLDTHAITPLADFPRIAGRFAYYQSGDYFYTIGGVTNYSGYITTNRIFRYHIPSDTWSEITNVNGVTAKFTAGFAQFDNKLLVFGGATSGLTVNSSSQIFTFNFYTVIAYLRVGETIYADGQMRSDVPISCADVGNVTTLPANTECTALSDTRIYPLSDISSGWVRRGGAGGPIQIGVIVPTTWTDDVVRKNGETWLKLNGQTFDPLEYPALASTYGSPYTLPNYGQNAQDQYYYIKAAGYTNNGYTITDGSADGQCLLWDSSDGMWTPGACTAGSGDPGLWVEGDDASQLVATLPYVGIGTTDPKYALDVRGVIAALGLLVNGDATISGALTAQTATVAGSLRADYFIDGDGLIGTDGQILAMVDGQLKWIDAPETYNDTALQTATATNQIDIATIAAALAELGSGTGTVTSVNDIPPDSGGNVELDAHDVDAYTRGETDQLIDEELTFEYLPATKLITMTAGSTQANQRDYGFKGTSLGKYLYSFGGFVDATSGHTANVHRFDLTNGDYQKLAQPYPHAVSQAVSVTDCNYIYIFGGSTFINLPTYNDAYRYDPANDSYTALTNLDTAIMGMSAVYYQGKVYLFAGAYDGKATSLSNQVIEYDIASKSYSTWLTTFPSGFSNSSAILIGNQVYMSGGWLSNTTYGNLFYQVDLEHKTITPKSLPPKAVALASIYQTAREIVYIGGVDVSGNAHNLIQRYDLASDSWSTISSVTGVASRWGSAYGQYQNKLLNLAGMVAGDSNGTRTSQIFTFNFDTVIAYLRAGETIYADGAMRSDVPIDCGGGYDAAPTPLPPNTECTALSDTRIYPLSDISTGWVRRGGDASGLWVTGDNTNQLRAILPYVGIGTSDPKYALDVRGVIAALGLIINGDATISGALTAQTATIAGSLRADYFIDGDGLIGTEGQILAMVGGKLKWIKAPETYNDTALQTAVANLKQVDATEAAAILQNQLATAANETDIATIASTLEDAVIYDQNGDVNLTGDLNVDGHTQINGNTQISGTLQVGSLLDSYGAAGEPGQVLAIDSTGKLRWRNQPVGGLTSDFSYTGGYQVFSAPTTGIYQIQAWGAAGGMGLTNNVLIYSGGGGAYTGGNLHLNQGDTLYIYVGGKGGNAKPIASSGIVTTGGSAGFNGGGGGGNDTSDDDASGGGGGASDIRYFIGGDPTVSDLNWDSTRGLASRIMVAGGGGGSVRGDVPTNNVGYGYPAGALTAMANSQGAATQTNGYAFGLGAVGVNHGTVPSSGGGGGYWGGVAGATTGAGNRTVAAGGGTSFISGYTGAVAIRAENDTTPRLDSTDTPCVDATIDNVCSQHFSNLIFTEAEMVAGDALMPNYAAAGSIIGNTSDGFVRLTLVSIDSENSVFWVNGDDAASQLGATLPRVGIGTSNPKYALDVAGIIGSEGLAVTGNATISGVLTAQTATISGTITAAAGAFSDLIDAYGNTGGPGQILVQDLDGKLKWVALSTFGLDQNCLDVAETPEPEPEVIEVPEIVLPHVPGEVLVTYTKDVIATAESKLSSTSSFMTQSSQLDLEQIELIFEAAETGAAEALTTTFLDPELINDLDISPQTTIAVDEQTVVELVSVTSDEPLEQVIAQLEAEETVTAVQPNYRYQLSLLPTTDPYVDRLWGLDNDGGTLPDSSVTLNANIDIDLTTAWEQLSAAGKTRGGGVVVAVADTGVKVDHEDLSSQMWSGLKPNGETCTYNGSPLNCSAGGYGFHAGVMTPDPNPEGSTATFDHGTHVAGTIAAAADNGKGVAGVAPDAKIMSLNVFTYDEEEAALFADSDDLIMATKFATENGADIINLSLGTVSVAGCTGYDLAWYTAMKNFPGLLVVAAGNGKAPANTGLSLDTYTVMPASLAQTKCTWQALPNMIVVGATTPADARASFSNYGSGVNLYAPGTYIFSTTSQNIAIPYVYKNGTSMATPHVSGVAALIKSLEPGFFPEQIKAVLTNLAGTPITISATQVKRLNAAASVDYVLTEEPPIVPEPSKCVSAGGSGYLWQAKDGSDDIFHLLGNVGIGRSDPRYALDVAGITASNGLLVSGEATVSGLLAQDAQITKLKDGYGNYGTAGQVLTTDASGRLKWQTPGTVVPDYAKMETTNRLGAQGSTWTVDRDGFVKLVVRVVGEKHPGSWMYHHINNKVVGTWGWGGSFNVGGTNLAMPSSNIAFENIYPVSVGDVASVSAYNNSDTVRGAYFIPPKIVSVPTSLLSSSEVISAFSFSGEDTPSETGARVEKLEQELSALNNNLAFLAEYDLEALQAKVDLINFLAGGDELGSTGNLLALADLIEVGPDVLAFTTPVRFDALATFTAGVTISGEATISGTTNLYGSLTLEGYASISGLLDLYRYTLPEDLAGLLVIPAGTDSASHTFTEPFARSPIINLTPVLHGYSYYLGETTTSGFSVYVEKAQDASASFNFSTTPVR